MRVLVVGNGAREHALCWKLAQSPRIDQLFAAPGNAGMEQVATCRAVAVDDHPGLIKLCRDETIDFVVVGPEAPLVAGLVDDLNAAGIRAFGPNKAAAALEGSKAFAKDFFQRHNIPTAAYRRFNDADAAEAYIREQGAPIVVKADGLAAGKGAIVCDTVDLAVAAARDILAGRFGDAGNEIVVEEFMIGEEASFFALSDGTNILPLIGAQDHKRVGDGDVGPNTGGMGAYSPAPVFDAAMLDLTMQRIIEPTVAGMAAEGRPFKGVLYAGLMITAEGPKMIEYNVRFGDPETQVILPRLASDLLPALEAAADGNLADVDLDWRDDAAVCVVMATEGYPEAYENGSEIRGLDRADAMAGVTVFHAGTKRDGTRILAHGGRVLGVTALASDVRTATDAAYAAVDAIDWPQGFCRTDIARPAFETEN